MDNQEKMENSSRTTAASAVAFTVLYLAAAFIPSLPEGADSDAEVLGLLRESDSRNLIILAGVLLPLAGLALLPFVSQLTASLRRAAPDSPVPGVVFGSGLLYIAMLFVSGNSFGGYATGIAVGELEMPADATLVRVLSDQGFGTLLVPGLMSAAVMVLASSLLARRVGVSPRWVCTVGFVFAPLMMLGAIWVPQFLVPVWTLIVAFTLRSPATVPDTRTPVGV
ncbi:MAG TPA: hypothetical protein VFD59_19430 [Nocardioidaceae bacterium]|nr:hypothetical protein [Nocardioidaceae bacterium]